MNKLIVKKYITFLLSLLFVDSIYLYGLKNIHNKVVKGIQNTNLQLRLLPGSIFYLLAPLSYVLFVDKLSNKNETNILKYGALMGLLMYGTFDATNAALFERYPYWYAFMDTLWGMFAIMMASWITFKLVG